MPFTTNDVLQYKRNDRQLREIHEREYSKYVANLRQQQQQQQQPSSHYKNDYYLSIKYLNEIERSRVRNALVKQNLDDRICRDNVVLYQRLLKASKRTMIDDKNETYQQNLTSFITKRSQQRSNEHNRIYNDNQILLQRIDNVRGRLIGKEQCDNDWNKHISFMKKNCEYPENIDKFVIKKNKNEQIQVCAYSAKKIRQWNDRHSIIEPSKQE
ncbi:unnamed protein product [Rotaria socialis]|uniref:Uncharacterized protein n=1 Tax=Rotaria socialis TaxID=392032 RepID=A0A818PBZ7_9BILA|nr:unnamed protein product [Rotaria socialis]CAF3616833.1 unnamed protein product [Rotaria socialis]CAF4211886.1 unnamed protein product [Rotaria socialis]CAF4312236.1 unnamed protein product [Rotaria socialis]